MFFVKRCTERLYRCTRLTCLDCQVSPISLISLVFLSYDSLETLSTGATCFMLPISEIVLYSGHLVSEILPKLWGIKLFFISTHHVKSITPRVIEFSSLKSMQMRNSPFFSLASLYTAAYGDELSSMISSFEKLFNVAPGPPCPFDWHQSSST